MLGRARRGELERESNSSGEPGAGEGWDHTVTVGTEPASPPPPSKLPLRPQLLALLADPRVDSLTAAGAARVLGVPQQDAQVTLDAMAQTGDLVTGGEGSRTYFVSAARKQSLESMFRDAAQELGELGALTQTSTDEALMVLEDDTDEPRLPVTAGLLSIFLPGTGQLLNGDVGRASLVFAVWSLAWITHLTPVLTFVSLYAGAEAFFTAKIRSMERKLAREAILGQTPGGVPPALPPKPSQS